jgi:hypothetical protein
MRRLLIALAATAVLGGLAACQTATPYQPAASPGRYATGFSEFRIDDSHWRVTFKGNSLTSRETVEKYLLYRAAELTTQQGFDWFEAGDRQTERHSRLVGVGGDPFYDSGFGLAYGWGWRPAWRYYGPRGWIGWNPWIGDPFWADNIDVEQIDRYEASAEVAMGKGPTPPNHKVFDARQVMANIGPSIVRPADKPPHG